MNFNPQLNTQYTLIFTKNDVDINSGTGYYYINGVKYNSTLIGTNTFATTVSNGNLVFGRLSYSTEVGNSNLIYNDFKFFNKQLSDSECLELYYKQGQIVPTTAKPYLQAECKFDDKSGLVLTDSSGNGYNGTLSSYVAGTTNLGATNSWVDKYGRALQYV